MRATGGRSAPLRARRFRRALITAAVSATVLIATTACGPIPIRLFGDGLAPNASPSVNVPGRFGKAFDVNPDGTAIKEVGKISATLTASDKALLKRITSQPVASWLGDWNANIVNDTHLLVQGATWRNAIAVLATYNMPSQDCGSYGKSNTAGQTFEQHRAWVRQFIKGLGTYKAIVIVEADSLAHTTCLSKQALADRLALIKDEVELIKAQGSWAYIDAGHAGWLSAKTIATRLQAAGVADAAGFSLNTGNTWSTNATIAYGTKISALAGGVHFVVDTSRNGKPRNDSAWCNPKNAGLGIDPTASTGHELVDAYLWIKNPGVSDGTCNGGSTAGTWMTDSALTLAKNAAN